MPALSHNLCISNESGRTGNITVQQDSMGTSILDLNIDSLVHCASSLNLQDLASMAMTCKHMREAVYTDSIWELQCRKRWPPKQVSWGTFQYCGGRDAYLDRHVASQQFRFLDPIDWHFNQTLAHTSHILLDDNFITVAQGHNITKWTRGSLAKPPMILCNLSGHKARITCMRLLPSTGVATCRSGGDGADLVTSSLDHTVRLWRKGRAVRTFRGHSSAVTTLGDGLLGSQYGTSVLASGGMDGTIRLWALLPVQNRGHSPLLKTFHSHEQAIKQLAVAEYNTSLLVSASKDLKVRVWDVIGAGALVGATRSPGVPVGLTCKGSLCFVAGGVSFMIIDVRLMKTIASVTAHGSGIVNFSVSSSGEAICTGGQDKIAKLWDMRNVEDPYAVLGNHCGAVHHVYMDSYKAVTGGFADKIVNVWDAKTGAQLHTLDSLQDSDITNVGVSAMAVSGARIVTATSGSMPGIFRLRDFSNCAIPSIQTPLESDNQCPSKFWESSFDNEA